ncbi:UNVERIFIED_CONTAM: hypothetical protein K2H54_040964 [Gekko kuhli]
MDWWQEKYVGRGFNNRSPGPYQLPNLREKVKRRAASIGKSWKVGSRQNIGTEVYKLWMSLVAKRRKIMVLISNEKRRETMVLMSNEKRRETMVLIGPEKRRETMVLVGIEKRRKIMVLISSEKEEEKSWC